MGKRKIRRAIRRVIVTEAKLRKYVRRLEKYVEKEETGEDPSLYLDYCPVCGNQSCAGISHPIYCEH